MDSDDASTLTDHEEGPAVTSNFQSLAALTNMEPPIAFFDAQQYSDQLRLYTSSPTDQPKHVVTVYAAIRTANAPTAYVTDAPPTVRYYIAATPEEIGTRAMAKKILDTTHKIAFKCTPCVSLIQNKVPFSLKASRFGCITHSFQDVYHVNIAPLTGSRPYMFRTVHGNLFEYKYLVSYELAVMPPKPATSSTSPPAPPSYDETMSGSTNTTTAMDTSTTPSSPRRIPHLEIVIRRSTSTDESEGEAEPAPPPPPTPEPQPDVSSVIRQTWLTTLLSIGEMEPSFQQLDRVLALANLVHHHVQPRRAQGRLQRLQPLPAPSDASRNSDAPRRRRAGRNRRHNVIQASREQPQPLPDLREQLNNPAPQRSPAFSNQRHGPRAATSSPRRSPPSSGSRHENNRTPPLRRTHRMSPVSAQNAQLDAELNSLVTRPAAAAATGRNNNNSSSPTTVAGPPQRPRSNNNKIKPHRGSRRQHIR